jgi:hypothetical protein
MASTLPNTDPVYLARSGEDHTPAVVGLAFEEVRFTTTDGVELTGWLVPHPQARGMSSPPVKWPGAAYMQRSSRDNRAYM